jgi:regulator of sigma E protease
MNWILAAVIFSGGFMIGVPADIDSAPASAITSDERIEATLVLSGSAAEAAGIQSGDVILAIDGTEPETVPEAKALLKTSDEGDERTFLISREDETIEIQAESAYIADLDAPGYGVVLTRVGNIRFPVHEAIAQGVTVTATFTYRIVEGFVLLIRDLIIRKPVDAEISGPVGIAVITGKVADQGIWALLQFTAILSLNLAVINFLPIPALDGGRAVFVVVEGLRRKRNNPRFEAAIHQIGFMLLLLLIFIVTIHDIRRYGTSIWNGLLSVVGLN